MSGSFFRRLIQTIVALAMLVAGPLLGTLTGSASPAQNVSASVQSTAPTTLTTQAIVPPTPAAGHVQPIAQVEAGLTQIVESTVVPDAGCHLIDKCQINLNGKPFAPGTVIYGPRLLAYHMQALKNKYYRVHYTWNTSNIFNTEDFPHKVTFGAWAEYKANEFYVCVRKTGNKEPLMVLTTGGKNGEARRYFVIVMQCDGRVHKRSESDWNNMNINGHGILHIRDQHPAVTIIYPQDCHPGCEFILNQFTLEVSTRN